MASNNYSDGGNDTPVYTFNGVSSYYPQTVEQQPSSNYVPQGHISASDVSNSSLPIETRPAISSAIVGKSSGRGRRKQRKKIDGSFVSNMKESNQVGVKYSNTVCDDVVALPPVQEVVTDKSMFSNEDPTIQNNHMWLNTNSLEQILSYKKMMLLQSPEVVEFLQKHQADNKK